MMRRFLLIITILLSSESLHAQLGSNQLAMTIAAMSPGTWAQVPQDATSIWTALNCAGECSAVGPNDHLLGDAQTGAWDRVRHVWSFEGMEHTSAGWTVHWTAEDNTWHVDCGDPRITNPDYNACGITPDTAGIIASNHGYQRNTVDPRTGIHYLSGSAGQNGPFYVDAHVPGATGMTTWTPISSNGPWNYGSTPVSVFWDGPIDGDPNGVILTYTGENSFGGELSLWHPTTNTYTQLPNVLDAGNTNPPGGPDYNCFAAYSGHLNAAYFGGCAQHPTRVFIVDSQANASNNHTRRLDDAPAAVFGIGDRYGLAVADPLTGFLLVMGGGVAGDGAGVGTSDWPRWFWYLDPNAAPGSQWNRLDNIGSNFPPVGGMTLPMTGVGDIVGGIQGGVTASLDDYGVTLWVSCTNSMIGSCSVFVYKFDTSLLPDFNTKCNAAGVISCYNFDSMAATRLKPTVGEPIRYGWDNVTYPACNSAGLGTRYPIAKPMTSVMGNSICIDEGGATAYFPTIDTAVKHAGAGSLHLPFPPQSDGIYFDTMLEGTDADNTKTWGVERLLGKSLWWQYYYRTHGMSGTFAPATVFGYKQFSAYPELSSTNNLIDAVDVINTPRGNILAPYNHTYPSLTQAHEATFLNTTPTDQLYVQSGSQCAYHPGGIADYQADPHCLRLQDDTWYEMTNEVRFIPSMYDGVISGTTLTSASAPFQANNCCFSVYIVGKGLFGISSYNSTSSVTLASAPGDATGLTVYVGNQNGNAQIRVWLDGRLVDDGSYDGGFKSINLAWGKMNPTPTVIGYAQFEALDQSTAATGTHPVADVWYDDLIFSTSPIPMGSGDMVTPPPTVTGGSRRHAHR